LSNWRSTGADVQHYRRVSQWEVTVLIPQTMTTTVTVITSIGSRGGIRSVPINDATFTASRLSGVNDSMPLMSRMTVSPVTSSLDGAVVNYFEGTTATESVAATTIRIIDPGQFGKKINKTITVILSMGRGWGRCSQFSIFQSIYVPEFTMRAHIIIILLYGSLLDLSVRNSFHVMK
jgi:hypothetical protein